MIRDARLARYCPDARRRASTRKRGAPSRQPFNGGRSDRHEKAPPGTHPGAQKTSGPAHSSDGCHCNDHHSSESGRSRMRSLSAPEPMPILYTQIRKTAWEILSKRRLLTAFLSPQAKATCTLIPECSKSNHADTNQTAGPISRQRANVPMIYIARYLSMACLQSIRREALRHVASLLPERRCRDAKPRLWRRIFAPRPRVSLGPH